HGSAEPRHQRFEVSDLIVDLSREQPGLVERTLQRLRLVALPLAPKTAADERHEGNDSGNHQAQQSCSDAPQHSSECPRRKGCRYAAAGSPNSSLHLGHFSTPAASNIGSRILRKLSRRLYKSLTRQLNPTPFEILAPSPRVSLTVVAGRPAWSR